VHRGTIHSMMPSLYNPFLVTMTSLMTRFFGHAAWVLSLSMYGALYCVN
jgi:hypothetical protein